MFKTQAGDAPMGRLMVGCPHEREAINLNVWKKDASEAVMKLCGHCAQVVLF